MRSLRAFAGANRLWRETRAPDMIEYALMAGFMAVAASAVLPEARGVISTVFRRVPSGMIPATGPAPTG